MKKNKSKKTAEKKDSNSKKITVQKLAQIMTDGFAQIRKESADGFAQAKKDNEDLAMMVKHGFDETNGRLTLLERSQQETNDRLELSRRDQEEIKLRLTNVVYRFELDELQKKTQKVEDIVLARRRKS